MASSPCAIPNRWRVFSCGTSLHRRWLPIWSSRWPRKRRQLSDRLDKQPGRETAESEGPQCSSAHHARHLILRADLIRSVMAQVEPDTEAQCTCEVRAGRPLRRSRRALTPPLKGSTGPPRLARPSTRWASLMLQCSAVDGTPTARDRVLVVRPLRRGACGRQPERCSLTGPGSAKQVREKGARSFGDSHPGRHHQSLRPGFQNRILWHLRNRR